jgi:hypothetical protein
MASPINDLRLIVRPRAARRMLGDCSNETLYRLLNSGELQSFAHGRARWIVAASIERYVNRRLDEASGTPKLAPAAAPPRRHNRQRLPDNRR